jgi:uncharacterized protein (DUF58 family)
MIPGISLYWLLGLTLVTGVGAVLLPELAMAWWLLFVATLVLLIIDAFMINRTPMPEVSRHLPASLPVGVATIVELKISNPAGRKIELIVFDHHPTEMEDSGLPQTITIEPGGFTRISYRIRPLKRGAFTFTGIQIRLRSPLRLLLQQRWLPLAHDVRVYPNFAPVAKYTLLATDNRLSQMGIRKHRRRGEGQDFHQLREYRQGDALRQIDWKASARIRKLISREYQDERDQEIIFLLDCGHRMLTKDDDLSHFDHSLNAILLLSYVALRQGDAVGFANFGNEPRWMPPFKGPALIHRLLNTLYDIEPGTGVPDYSEAARRLLLRQKKRALIVLITNLRDEDPGDLLPAIQLMRKRHLVLVASMREQALDETLAQTVGDFEQAIVHAATREYLNRRDEAMDQLKSHKTLYLDVPPHELSVTLVNRYLDIKSSGQL